MSRIRRRVRSEAGASLAEVLVTITILGLSVAGIVQALGTASLASDYHRKQVNADIVVRSYAEAIKERARRHADGYVPCASPTDTNGDGVFEHPYGGTHIYQPPSGYTVSAVPVTEYQDVLDLKNIILVLDRSGSIEGSEQTDVRDAAKAFVNGLKNTGTYLSLISFSTQASVNVPPTELDDAGAVTFVNAIDNLAFTGGTNWEAALIKATDQFTLFPGFPETPAPRIVFVTDGEPTFYLDPDTDTSNADGPGSGFSQTALDQAEQKADILKSEGSQVLAFGVALDTAAADDHLQELAWTEGTPGPFEWDLDDPDSDLKQAHWSEVQDFDQLEDALAEAARELSQDTFSAKCPITDLGSQRLTLQAASTDGRDTEKLQIIIRKHPQP
ncbi:MAG: VWA domain-containing protein [Acidimicrobiia bacterium]